MAGLIALAAAGGGAAQADTVFTFNNNLSGAEVVGLVGANNQPFGVYAGRYQAQIGPAQGQGPISNIFCVDFTHEIQLGDYYTANTQQLLTAPAGTLTNGYYNGGLASALNSSDYSPTGTMAASQRADEVAYLADNYLNATSITFTGGASGSTDLNNNLAAVSLSIWDIMQDGANGLGTGSVQLWNPAGTQYSSLYNYSLLTSLTGYYETQAAANAGYQSNTAYWIQAPRNSSDGHDQDYVIEGGGGVIPHGPAAVPEPASLFPMLLGMSGLAALAVARRRKAGARTL